jgi:hypothetical protein
VLHAELVQDADDRAAQVVLAVLVAGRGDGGDQRLEGAAVVGGVELGERVRELGVVTEAPAGVAVFRLPRQCGLPHPAAY